MKRRGDGAESALLPRSHYFVPRAQPARTRSARAVPAAAPRPRGERMRLLRDAGGLVWQAAVRLPRSTTRIVAAFMPLTRLVAQPAHIGVPELAAELDRIFAALYEHPLTEQTRRFTGEDVS